MCVIFLAIDQHPEFRVLLIANRDEFYDRPTAPAETWSDFPNIYAGRDLVAGGTWLGVTNEGRFAAVTNYRDPNAAKGSISRGALVADFLKSSDPAYEYLQTVQRRADKFSGFNLLAGEVNARKCEIFYYSNRVESILRLSTGLYGLSNHLLDSAWRKVTIGKARIAETLKADKVTHDELFSILSDETFAADEELPDTGIGYEREKAISSIFIKTPLYGTRNSTVLSIDKNLNVDLDERVYV